MIALLLACIADDLQTFEALRQPIETEQTQVLHAGPVWLTDDQDAAHWPEPDGFFPHRLFPVTDWSPDRVQVVAVDDDLITLQLWLDRRDLDVRPYQDTLGWSGEGQVELPGGYPIEVLWEEEDLSRIRVATHDLDIETFVEAIDLDHVWRAGPGHRRLEIGEDIVYLPDAAHLLEHPDGDAFATFHPVFDDAQVFPHPAEVLDHQDDHLLVRVVDGPVAVTGWVEHWAEHANGGFGWGGCHGCSGLRLGHGIRLATNPNVPADTPLLAADGTVIGITHVPMRKELGEPTLWGFRSMSVDTPWGPIDVYVEL